MKSERLFILQKKNLGNFDSDLSLSESELETIDLISKDTNVSTLIIFWQFILKGLDELSIVTNTILSLEMLIIKLIHLKSMPSYEAILDLINKNNLDNKDSIVSSTITKSIQDDKSEINKISKDQIKNTTQTKPELTPLNPADVKKDETLKKISSFEDLIKLSSSKKEIELKYDLEKNVNLIKFSEGKIDISFNENLRKNFVRNLSEKLLEWTGKRWVITLTKELGQKTFSEQQSDKKKTAYRKRKKSRGLQKI